MGVDNSGDLGEVHICVDIFSPKPFHLHVSRQTFFVQRAQSHSSIDGDTHAGGMPWNNLNEIAD